MILAMTRFPRKEVTRSKASSTMGERLRSRLLAIAISPTSGKGKLLVQYAVGLAGRPAHCRAPQVARNQLVWDLLRCAAVKVMCLVRLQE